MAEESMFASLVKNSEVAKAQIGLGILQAGSIFSSGASTIAKAEVAKADAAKSEAETKASQATMLAEVTKMQTSISLSPEGKALATLGVAMGNEALLDEDTKTYLVSKGSEVARSMADKALAELNAPAPAPAPDPSISEEVSEDH